MTHSIVRLNHVLFIILICSILSACGGSSESGKVAPDDDDNGSNGTANAKPSISILSPDGSQLFSDATEITFRASSEDAEDGDISEFIEWNSSLDGVLGSGAQFTTNLRSGEHVISANITDSDGETAEDSIQITVNISQGVATVSWIPPSLNTDGTNLNDLAGYKILLGQSENNLNQYWIVDASRSDALLENLTVGATYYYAVLAFNQFGIESQTSSVSSFQVED